MKHWFLAVAVLLGGAVGLASADYIIIKANVGQPRHPPMTRANGPNGQFPGPGGSGGPMPIGGRGGPRPGGTGGGSFPGGPMPGGTGGGSFPGVGDPMPGMGGMGTTADAGQPIDILAVVEVEANSRELQEYAKLEYDPNDPRSRLLPPLVARHHLGRTKEDVVRLLNIKGRSPEVTFEAVACKTVAKRYEEQYANLFPKNKPDAKPSPDEILKVAEWALTHGLNDKVVDLIKKLAEVNKDHPVVAAFNQLQADLDKPVKDAPGDLGARLQGYTQETLQGGKGHYVLFYSVNNNNQAEVQDRLKRLEDALHTFYYWFALNAPDLILHRTVHIPEERLPALLAMREDEFRRQHDGFSDPPVVAAGFFARRENLAVLCARPQDPTYDMLLKASDWIWSQPGWNRYDILTGKDKMGYPPGDVAPGDRPYAGTLALLTKALEDESARASVSQDATRQLLFASGLLPRNVTVPEWVQFGVGSFFETPPAFALAVARRTQHPLRADLPRRTQRQRPEVRGRPLQDDAQDRHRRLLPRAETGGPEEEIEGAGEGAGRDVEPDVLPRQAEAGQPGALLPAAGRDAARPGAGRADPLGLLRPRLRRLRPQDEAGG